MWETQIGISPVKDASVALDDAPVDQTLPKLEKRKLWIKVEHYGFNIKTDHFFAVPEFLAGAVGRVFPTQCPTHGRHERARDGRLCTGPARRRGRRYSLRPSLALRLA